ncbi:MAG: SUMF1/EgtB/PvdO family nonheme iron enzyme [Candidatus Brocadiaceae bacterium]|jgi:formylglycine-generating enzyme required for sulfatase activity
MEPVNLLRIVVVVLACLGALSLTVPGRPQTATGRGAPYPGTSPESLAELEAKLQEAPQDHETLYDLAAAYYWGAGDPDSAQPVYERLLRVNPEHWLAHYDLGHLLNTRGRHTQALHHWKRFLKLHPERSGQANRVREMVSWYESLTTQRGEPVASKGWEVEGDTVTNSIGMVFVRIPGGESTMGYAGGKHDQRPEHVVALDPYWMGKYGVTAGQFRRFLQESGYRSYARFVRSPVNKYSRTEDHPVVFLTWHAATALTVWLSSRERAVYSLPSEAEWELAARGSDGRTNRWGNSNAEPGKHGNLGRFDRITRAGELPTVEEVGSCPAGASPFGLLDMAGNADEWCLDWYHPDFYGSSPERNPFGPVHMEGRAHRVLRGENWRFRPGRTHAVQRNHFDRTAPYDCFGFRIVRELDAAERWASRLQPGTEPYGNGPAPAACTTMEESPPLVEL